MKTLKAIGLAVGVLALCAAFGAVGSFLSQPSVHAAAKHEVAASSEQKPSPVADQSQPTKMESLAVQTAQEATGLPQ